MKGRKPKVRRYKPSELKNIRVPNPMETRTRRQIIFAHTLLHWAWKGKALMDWRPKQVIAEHFRVVSIMVEKNIKHKFIDSLDNTLPKSLLRLI